MSARNINGAKITHLMPEEKKMKQNTEDEYKKALASDDPTKMSKNSQEDMVREAIKKFKSLQ